MGFYAGAHISPTAQTVIDRMTDLNIVQKGAINRLVQRLVWSGDWTNLDSIYLFQGLGSEANSVVDLKGRQNCLAVNSPGWTNTDGFTTDGSTSYIDFITHEDTLTQYQNTNASYGAVFNIQDLNAIRNVIGIYDTAVGAKRTLITIDTDDSVKSYGPGGGNTDVGVTSNGLSNQLWSAGRTVNTIYTYLDGVQVSSAVISGNLANHSFYGMCRNQVDVPVVFMSSGEGITMAYFGNYSVSHLNIYNAFQRYKTDLGIV